MWDWLTSLFSGKGGTTQIGSRNTANTAGGDITHTHVEGGVHLHAAPKSNEPFTPSKSEAELLTRLHASTTQTLHVVKVDSWAKFVVLIDTQPLSDFNDTEACIRFYEAVTHLQSVHYLVQTGENTFHLSEAGKAAASSVTTTASQLPPSPE